MRGDLGRSTRTLRHRKGSPTGCDGDGGAAIAQRMAADFPLTEYRTGSDPRTLRDALGCFATGVTVVTAIRDDGVPVGLDGQQLHVGVARPAVVAGVRRQGGGERGGADRRAGISRSTCCRPASSPNSIRFSTRAEDRFGTTIWSPGEYGAPILQESLSVFECERHGLYEGGDHHILVGQVVKATLRAAPRSVALFPRKLPPAALRLSGAAPQSTTNCSGCLVNWRTITTMIAPMTRPTIAAAMALASHAVTPSSTTIWTAIQSAPRHGLHAGRSWKPNSSMP